MGSEKLTAAEGEFVAEMFWEDNCEGGAWRTFDPDFRQGDIKRLFARGWFEKRGTGRHREYSWTPAGRSALSTTTKGEGDE